MALVGQVVANHVTPSHYGLDASTKTPPQDDDARWKDGDAEENLNFKKTFQENLKKADKKTDNVLLISARSTSGSGKFSFNSTLNSSWIRTYDRLGILDSKPSTSIIASLASNQKPNQINGFRKNANDIKADKTTRSEESKFKGSNRKEDTQKEKEEKREEEEERNFKKEKERIERAREEEKFKKEKERIEREIKNKERRRQEKLEDGKKERLTKPVDQHGLSGKTLTKESKRGIEVFEVDVDDTGDVVGDVDVIGDSDKGKERITNTLKRRSHDNRLTNKQDDNPDDNSDDNPDDKPEPEPNKLNDSEGTESAEADDNKNNSNAIFCSFPPPNFDFTTHVERLRRSKDVAKKAHKQSHVYLIGGNGCGFVHQALTKRGWMQKIVDLKESENVYKQINAVLQVEAFYRKVPYAPGEGETSKKKENKNTNSQAAPRGSSAASGKNHQSIAEVKLNSAFKQRQISLIRQCYRTELIEMSNLLKTFVPNFFWTCSKTLAMRQLLDLRPDVIWNHFGTCGNNFTTKEGLCAIMNDIHWKLPVDRMDIIPRCYRLSRCEEKEDFIVDFKITACISLLKHVVENYLIDEKPDEEVEADVREQISNILIRYVDRDNEIFEEAQEVVAAKESKKTSNSSQAIKASENKSLQTKNRNRNRSKTPSRQNRNASPLKTETHHNRNSNNSSGDFCNYIGGCRNERCPERRVLNINNNSIRTQPWVEAVTQSKHPGEDVLGNSVKSQVVSTATVTTTGVFPAPLSLRTVELAFIQLESLLSHQRHEDVDKTQLLNEVTDAVAQRTWPRLLKYVEEVTSGNRTLTLSPDVIERCKAMLERVQGTMPQYGIDGTRNMWILKPPSLSRGRGITISRDLDEILKVCATSRVVCQKYIERPLTIYGTKFDIRQWFLVSCWSPLTVWWYDECYIRFSSQVFSLDNFDESIHLTNNAIQANYKNQASRSSLLPNDNMWDTAAFAQFCKAKRGSDVFNAETLPRMKEQILSTLRGSSEFMISRVNSFELYGADFMMSEDFSPWLIEVNSSPALGGTTSITKRMCKEVCDDALKVVLDRRSDPSADTGRFTLLYQEKTPTKEALNKELSYGAQFKVCGTAINKPGKSGSNEQSNIPKRIAPWKP